MLLLLTLAVGVDPVLTGIGFRGNLLEWMLAFALVAAVLGVWHHGASRRFLVGSGIALLGWLTLHAVAFGGGPSLTPAALGIWSLWLAGAMLSVVLASGRVDGERICAALSVYMLAGLAFGGFFATLEAIEPGSLLGGETDALDPATATYFSFVTLATGSFQPRKNAFSLFPNAARSGNRELSA